MHLSEQGWVLSPRTETVTLFGKEAAVYDATGPTEPTWLWRTSASPIKAGGDFGVGPFRVAGIAIVATDAGIVLAILESEKDTDDAEILRGRFDRMLETLSSN